MSGASITAYVDGGARGNPGPAAAAAVFFVNGEEVARVGKFLDTRTNNQAEYEAVLLALEEAKKHGASELYIFSDSELIVHQLNGKYKVKNGDLQTLFLKARDAMREFSSVELSVIPREKNSVADALVNATLDGSLGS